MTKHPHLEGASEVGDGAPELSRLPVVTDTRLTQGSGAIALIGSGELADAMAETHRALMARLESPVRPVFLDTPAGFESNIDAIDHKAVEYFRRNFGLSLEVARYRSGRESAEDVGAALRAIGQANYILAGPGSPSYAIRVLRESPVWQAVVARWRAGALLVFASAAALSVGTWAIPVYEIYKAGYDPEWIEGLNLLGAAGQRRLAVVPHWNNASGEHDTRYCYMGAARFETLEQQLPADALVLGLDEYSALFIRPDRDAEVLGSGRVTLRTAGRQSVYARGDHLALHHPHTDEEAVPVSHQAMVVPPRENGEAAQDADILATRVRVEQAFARRDIPEAVHGLIALSLLAGSGFEQSLPGRAELAVQALQGTLPGLVRLLEAIDGAEKARQESQLLVDLLVSTRAVVRDSRQWAEADRVREQLERLGYVIADTPAGTSWTRAKTPTG